MRNTSEITSKNEQTFPWITLEQDLDMSKWNLLPRQLWNYLWIFVNIEDAYTTDKKKNQTKTLQTLNNIKWNNAGSEVVD